MKAQAPKEQRTLVVAFETGDIFPDSVRGVLDSACVASGVWRGSAEVRDVDATLFGVDHTVRTIHLPGPIELVRFEGHVAMDAGRPRATLRALANHPSPFGDKLVAMHVSRCTFVRGNAVVTAWDDTALAHPSDPERSHYFEIASGDESLAQTAAHRAAPPVAARAPSPLDSSPAMDHPIKPPAKRRSDHPDVFADFEPEPGDTAEHFAFGRCEVVRFDGDRLHIRTEREGKVLEIAVSVLNVIPVQTDTRPRHFRLERKR